MKKGKLRKILRAIMIPAMIVIVFILSLEIGLRILGRGPRGIFFGWTPGDGGLYPENAVIKMPGPIPYTIRVNSHGFRGPEIEVKKPAGRIRIAAVGDSTTDGFFVDNESTYPFLLQETLINQGRDVEVINAAHGGGSINKELAILCNNVLPMDPDIVILLFVTNDISDIRGIPRTELVDREKVDFRPIESASIFHSFITRTAIGELFFDTYLHIKSPAYRRAKEIWENPRGRYRIKGGDHFQQNVQRFLHRFYSTDGMVLVEPFSPEVHTLLSNYFFALNRFSQVCSEHKVSLLFVYFPAYSQVYGKAPSTKIQDKLADRCARQSIPFLDLTPVFRREGQNRVLHLAPIDFHLNPHGNRVMAEAIALKLTQSGLLRQKEN